MKKGLIQLNPYSTKENTVESYVCFGKFIAFLQNKIATESGSRVQFYKIVLEKLQSFPELRGGVPVEQMEGYEAVLELVGAIVFPMLEDDDEVLMGFTNAGTPEVFYATNAFHRMFAENGSRYVPQEWAQQNDIEETHRKFQYNLVLKNVYGQQLPERSEMIHRFFNPVTQLYQYYRLNIDARFVDIKVKDNLPVPTGHFMNEYFDCGKPAEKIETILPLDHFYATGFCIVTLTEVTVQQAIEQIGKAVAATKGHDEKDSNMLHITRLLQTIVGSNQYQFGMMPFFKINNRAALPYENFNFSILVKTCFDAGISKAVFTRYINHYLKHPDWIEYEAGASDNVLPVPVQKALQKAGIHYYALLPVYFNDELVGMLEVASPGGVPALDESQGIKLKPAIPYLAQLLVRARENFKHAIDAIIRDKFTNIQSSVQWKFNEVAWHYFRSHDIEHSDIALEKIVFKDVYPLYGAVDIRNSTIERNKVLREDLEFQLAMLIDLLDSIAAEVEGKYWREMADTCRNWLMKMVAYVSVEEEQEFNDFLYSEVHPIINLYENLPKPLADKVAVYYQSVDKDNGQSFAKRRQLENSMQMLNSVVGQYFDFFNSELQGNYPCYFEKFRTDGVEYDIYIGQSIAPQIPFEISHVEKLRLWQVQSMAAITKLTHSLLPQLEYPLQTTQLIFVNARTIDISFRNDERRFDVEGAYNIRYHIVKKRIDKVHIAGSVERLTQPGKIAIVYFNEKDAAGYISTIKKLQRENILLDDLEHLQLEELQGVAGLKALRVGVKLEALPATINLN